MNIIALITARGGSKGIPRKNLQLIAGKPLITWTIETALKSRGLRRIIVSTDDEEIALVSSNAGAEVPFIRPSELAQDKSPHISVVLHALKWLRDHEKDIPEYVVLLQPTSPLRIAEDIDGVINFAYQKNAEAVVTVVETHAHPYLTKKLEEDARLQPFSNCPLSYPRRQDLPPAYFINGAVFMNKVESLAEKKTFYPNELYGFVMPSERSLQIDTPWDLYLVELILRDQGVKLNAGGSCA